MYLFEVFVTLIRFFSLQLELLCICFATLFCSAPAVELEMCSLWLFADVVCLCVKCSTLYTFANAIFII